MASTALSKSAVAVTTDLTGGIVRDVPRNLIPPNAVYDARDYLFDIPGKVRKRGGCGTQSAEVDETILVSVAAPEFPGDPRVLIIGSDGADTRTLYDVTTDTPASGVDVNGAQPAENPPLSVDKLIITSGFDVDYPPQKAFIDTDVVDVDDLGGDPPNARLSCVHLSYLILANTEANPNRLWFSPIPDIEATWDTDNAYIDVPSPITGLASIQGVLLVFSRGITTRILGDVPPGTEGENMSQQPLGAVGCIDARSIVTMNNLVFFADESGVYYTNGAGYQSITDRDKGYGISVLWQEAMVGFAPMLGAVVSAGVFLNQYLFLTIRHPDVEPTRRYQFLYYEPTGAWTTLSDGVTAGVYATRFAPNAELYATPGDPDDPVILLRLSPLLDPTGDNMEDSNEETVLPVLETRAVYPSPGESAFQDVQVTYRLQEDESSPSLVVTQGVGIEPSSFGTVPEGSPLPPNDVVTRKRVMSAKYTNALTLRLTQVGASAQTEVHAFEVGYRVDPLSESGPL